MSVGLEAGNNIYFYLCFSGFHNFLDVESWFFNSLHLKIRQLSDDNGQFMITKVESSCKIPHLNMKAKWMANDSYSHGYEQGVESLSSEHSLLKPYCSQPGNISRNGLDWYSILKNIIAAAGPLRVLILGITMSAMSVALQDYGHCTKI